MYLPEHFAISDVDSVAAYVESVGAADIVTFSGERLVSSLVPVIWDRSVGEHGRLLAHISVANSQWREAKSDVPALAIVHGPQAYISPSWYASKRDHGRVVPTWNYSAVHFAGRAEVHEDPAWLLDAVTRLTDAHEGNRAEPWAVDDAPGPYIDKQLRAIVGVEFAIERIEGKAKLSQNRDDADAAGVVAGLRREGGAREQQVADAMEAVRPGEIARTN